jgi:hypothetical protein
MLKRLTLSLLMLLMIAPSAQAFVYMSEKDVEIVAKRACKMHNSGQYTRGEIDAVIDSAVPKSTITDTSGLETLEKIKLQDEKSTSQYKHQVFSAAKKNCKF